MAWRLACHQVRIQFCRHAQVKHVLQGRKVGKLSSAPVQDGGLCAEFGSFSCQARRFSSRSHPGVQQTPSAYDEAFRRARDQPEDFWGEQAENIVWTRRWDRVLDATDPVHPQWFPGGELNVCYNAVDRHVEAGFGDHTAIIHDSPVTNTIQHISYREFQEQVSKFAGVLSKYGVQKGDRVLIYMPMAPEAMVAMLASARLGAIHSLVFGGFGGKELATRVGHAKPKVIVTASCGVEPSRIVQYQPMVQEALQLSGHQPAKVILHNRPVFSVSLPSDLWCCWDEEMSAARPHDCVPVDAMFPLYLLYTSGTTGLPKAVVRPSGGHAVMLYWSMWNIYGMKPQEAWWAASDLGWVVGHSYICYAPLLHGNTTVIYEGKPVGTPDAGAFFRVMSEHKTAGMFTAPTAIRAIRKVDPNAELAKKYPLPHLRNFYVAGEHCDSETLHWTREVMGVPVLDHWWQTETGSAITASHMGLGDDGYPTSGVSGKPVPGWDVRVLHDETGEEGDGVTEETVETSAGELGQIVVKLPLPPGSFSTLWDNDTFFKELYFSTYPGYYDTMDAGIRDEKGYIAVMSRADDVINVAGHRLSSGSLEEAILEHPDLADCAVVGLEDSLKGHVPLGLCVLKSGVTKPEEAVLEEVVATVRKTVGPVAAFKKAIAVKRLPKTRSGKIARASMAKMINGKPYKIPVTIEDPAVYKDLEKQLANIIRKN